MIRAALASLLAAIVLHACAPSAGSVKTDAFTPAQRTRVVGILRDALKKDPSILREAILALQTDNARIEAVASHAAIAKRYDAVFNPRDPIAGNPRGRVVIAEFFDPRCAYCRQLSPQMTHFLARDREVRLVYKDLPILGPASDLGSRALLAAQRQRGYERLRVALMGDPREITTASIRRTAEKLGLNWRQLRHDMGDPTIARRLTANKRLAQTLGIDGTPTFIIDGKIVAGADMAKVADAVDAAQHSGLHKQDKTTMDMSTISQE